MSMNMTMMMIMMMIFLKSPGKQIIEDVYPTIKDLGACIFCGFRKDFWENFIQDAI